MDDVSRLDIRASHLSVLVVLRHDESLAVVALLELVNLRIVFDLNA